MSFPFNPHHGHVFVDAVLSGPHGTTGLRLILDSGATDTLISPAPLKSVGYDPASATQLVHARTGSGTINVPFLPVARLTALGVSRVAFPVLVHTMRLLSNVDGVLGLDFFRGLKFEIDFRNGTIDLS